MTFVVFSLLRDDWCNLVWSMLGSVTWSFRCHHLTGDFMTLHCQCQACPILHFGYDLNHLKFARYFYFCWYYSCLACLLCWILWLVLVWLWDCARHIVFNFFSSFRYGFDWFWLDIFLVLLALDELFWLFKLWLGAMIRLYSLAPMSLLRGWYFSFVLRVFLFGH